MSRHLSGDAARQWNDYQRKVGETDDVGEAAWLQSSLARPMLPEARDTTLARIQFLRLRSPA